MKLKHFLLFTLVVGLTSCGGNDDNAQKSPTSKGNKNEKDLPLTSETSELINSLFNNIPSPLTLSYIMKEAGIPYSPNIVHDPEKATSYVDKKSQAINLGIYGTNLTYANIMERSTDAMKYMAACIKLHESLGLSEAVGVELMARMEKNQENKDSMRFIISESLGSLEEYLRENEQIDVAGMILAGGVIEALYIATQLIDMNSPQPDIAQLIADQKYSVQSLHELFESYATNENLSFYINDIRKIWSIYEQMPEVKIESAGSTDGDMMVIGASKKIEITPQQIASLKATVQEIRNNYIKI